MASCYFNCRCVNSVPLDVFPVCSEQTALDSHEILQTPGIFSPQILLDLSRVCYMEVDEFDVLLNQNCHCNLTRFV
jgi:hypothetical protein